MPEDNKNSGLFSTLMSRIWGPQEAPQQPPEITEALTIAKQERPDLAAVEMYGPLSRMMQPRAEGYVSPARTIYLNPDMLKGKQPQEIADTLIHEQTHVDQMKRRGKTAFGELLSLMMGGNEPYGHRPEEMEAFQVEKRRRSKMGRPQTAIPSFANPTEFRVPQDIELPLERKKR